MSNIERCPSILTSRIVQRNGRIVKRESSEDESRQEFGSDYQYSFPV